MAAPEVKELAQKAAQANKDHQYALKVYTERLEAELEIVDRLLAMADVSDHEDDLELDAGGTVMVPSSVKARTPVNSGDLLSELSPFHDDAARRQQYVDWTVIHPMKPTELEALADAVRSENYRLHALDAQRRGHPAFGGLNDFPPGYFELNKDGIDWERVAMKVSSSNPAATQRTAPECKIRWLGERHPRFNHTQWTQSEIAKLRALTEGAKEGEIDWVEIAAKLGTRRTPLDCMRHAIIRRTHTWTPEYDRKLLQAVKIYGSDNWSLVARMVSEDATPQQCQNRYLRSLDPGIRRGGWTEDEDEKLRQAVAVFGHSWSEVSTFVAGRTNEQCRDRYQEYLSPYSSRARWTDEMEQLLLDAVEKIGYGKWREISEMVGHGRTDTMCRTRYSLLMKRREAATATPPVPPEPPGHGHIIDLTETEPEAQCTPSGSAPVAQPITFIHAPTPAAQIPPVSTIEQTSTNSGSEAPAAKPKPKPRRRKAAPAGSNMPDDGNANLAGQDSLGRTEEPSAAPNAAPQVRKPKPKPRPKKPAPIPASGEGENITSQLTDQTAAASEHPGPNADSTTTPSSAPEVQRPKPKPRPKKTTAAAAENNSEPPTQMEGASHLNNSAQSGTEQASNADPTPIEEPTHSRPPPRPRKDTKRPTPSDTVEGPAPKKRRTGKLGAKLAPSPQVSAPAEIPAPSRTTGEADSNPPYLSPRTSQDNVPSIEGPPGPQDNPDLSAEALAGSARTETPAVKSIPIARPQRGRGRKPAPARRSTKTTRTGMPESSTQLEDTLNADIAPRDATSYQDGQGQLQAEANEVPTDDHRRRPRRAAAVRSGYSSMKS
ncbi:hypothetical protein CERSUDRAFT_91875 [Gelatoporia subvermispora B]|uniref:Uncharacterized protein n=1 Tax=Ceriporiopsis subvermispora (strain B) TaxID=914234 RepID=M2RRP7_CERS8|nr:hypothetical protein CERSUDRAFT_91875 [Gelatoporia subvermispora B]